MRDESRRSLETARSQRTRLGIDPSRLLVLELTFVGADLRSRLEEKFRVRIVEERRVEDDYENPFYEVHLAFDSEEEQTRFRKRDDLDALGVTDFRAVRQSDGKAALDELCVQFPDLDSAKNFRAWLVAESEVDVHTRNPKRVSRVDNYRMLVQFPDAASIDDFEQELALYQESAAYQEREAGNATLTYIQRQELFDALDDITLVRVEDRMGARLRSEGAPEEDEFYFDVDLWHPGTASKMREVEGGFREIVEEAGGRVTDQREVADSLFLARVRGNHDTLEKVLRYDQAARVDLPPVFEVPDFEEPDFDLFNPVNVPEALADPEQDFPLACIVDSGITEGHPLLSGLVVYGKNIDSGEPDEYDNVGHGTHVAGIAVYGDVRACAKNDSWNPQIRLLNAKIMRKASYGDDAVFADDKRVENQIEEAVKWGVQEHGCRVFNLSFGNSSSPYQGGRQHPWALVLDELARTYDVVFVVAAGNAKPEVPAVSTSDEFQEAVLENTLSEKHNVIDPGCAVNVLTVGAIARTDVPHPISMRYPGDVRPMVAVPKGCPSPFTRTGLGVERGRGLQRAIKPDLAAYGGNYLVGRPHESDWKRTIPTWANLRWTTIM